MLFSFSSAISMTSVAVLLSLVFYECAHCALYTNHWAVEMHGSGDVEAAANELAAKHGFRNLGKVGNLDGVYWFQHDGTRTTRSIPQSTIADNLRAEEQVIWAEQQEVRERPHRNAVLLPSDPRLREQWYIKNTGQARGPPRLDHNIVPVWETNLTGRGVVVGIVDDGIEYRHPDLAENYAAHASYDFIENDRDAKPLYNTTTPQRHGTRCAGIVAAAANNICGVGIAYNSRIASIRVLSKGMTDLREANGLSYQTDNIDIFTASWGPVDKGEALDGPGPLTKRAMRKAAEQGREGKGTIYVWATGNGGLYDDSCACDGYVSSIYTIGVSSVTDRGASPWYAEWCASTLVSTYSSGIKLKNMAVLTTDLNGKCTSQHTGTSASAPMAAAIIALMLEANPRLTWRDVQHILVRTADITSPDDSDWITNGAGFRVNHKFGFGIINALKAVGLARTWWPSPRQAVCIVQPHDIHNVVIPVRTRRDIQPISVYTDACKDTDQAIGALEHVVLVVTITTSVRGSVAVTLTSPQGTTSTMLPRRRRDRSTYGFRHWQLMTTHSWGENPVGEWKVKVTKLSESVQARLVGFELHFYGTEAKPRDFHD